MAPDSLTVPPDTSFDGEGQVLVIEDDELYFAILQRQLRGIQTYVLVWYFASTGCRFVEQ